MENLVTITTTVRILLRLKLLDVSQKYNYAIKLITIYPKSQQISKMLQKNNIITFLNCFTNNPLNCRKENPIEDTFLLRLKENHLRDLQSPLTSSIIRNLRNKLWIAEQKK